MCRSKAFWSGLFDQKRYAFLELELYHEILNEIYLRIGEAKNDNKTQTSEKLLRHLTGLFIDLFHYFGS